MSTCNGCLNAIESDKYLQCQTCNGFFHSKCLNINDEHLQSLSQSYKDVWLCPSCSNVSHRRKPNIDTPVRQRQLLQAEDTMNMSFDVHNGSTVTNLSLSESVTGLPGCSAVTMENISSMFDQKLNATLATYMRDFRNALKEDVKSLVRAEMVCVTQELKNDLNSVTDYINSEQETIKSQIAEKDTAIKVIESDCERLHSEIVDLKNRMSAVEISTRNYNFAYKEQQCRMNNLEISGVPLSRSENLYNILQSIATRIGIAISSEDIDHIHRVRRFASQNTSDKNMTYQTQTPNIIVRFTRRHKKSEVLAAVRARRGITTADLDIDGPAKPVFLNEHLTPANKVLYSQVRKLGKECGYAYIWVKDCKIFVRKSDTSKPILISSESDLSKIK